MLFQTLLLPLLASAGSCSRLPQPIVPAVIRAPASPPSLILRDAEANLEPRIDASQVFDIGFQLQNEELYAGSWDFAPPAPILIPGTPVTVEPKDTIAFTLNCNDCRTYGEIVAELDTEGEGVSVGLTFNKAGAYLDFGVSASNTLTATFALGQFLSTKNSTLKAPSKNFEAKIGLGLNLVLSFTTAIDLTGGFQLCIPDGTKFAFNVDIGLDGETGLTAAADVTAFPKVTFSLLPIEISSTAVNITAALVLKAEAAINATIGAVSGIAAAGASLTIVEINLGQTTTNQEGQCSRALFADLESNAGAFAKADLILDEDSIFDDPPNVNVSTVFATAGTTACVGTQIPTIPSLSPAKQSSDAVQCAGGAAATTSLTTTIKTNTLISCLAPVVNCPNSLTQVVIITKEEATTTTFCPGAVPTTTTTQSLAARGEAHYTPYPTITTTVTTTTYPSYTSTPYTNLPANNTISISVSLAPPASSAPSAPACPTGGIPLSQLSEFITAPLADYIKTIAPAENATITGSPELPATTSGLPPIVSPPIGIVTAGAGRVGTGAGLGLVVGLVGGLVLV